MVPARTVLVRYSVVKRGDTEAYEGYLKGRHQLHLRTRESIELAQNYFEQATALDPNFALAWADQALAALLLNSYGNTVSKLANAQARALLSRARAIDSELAEALAVEGLILSNEWHYDRALGFLIGQLPPTRQWPSFISGVSRRSWAKPESARHKSPS
jgi:tetratricopeptide (TPR) repeat protein